MRLNLTILAIFLTGGALYAGESFSQNIVIQLKNTNLETVFGEIESQTGYAFFYDENIPASTFDAEFRDVRLDKVLNDILKPFNLGYRVRGKQIVIIEEVAESPKSNPAPVVQDDPPRRVGGTVTDDDGNPVAGVLVVVQGTSLGTATDGNGQFTLNNIPADGTLLFSSIGYDPVEAPVNDRGEINVSLTTNALHIEEIIAVGYGTQVKENLTGAVEVISSKALIDRPAMNTSQLLQGNVSGVNFSYNNYGSTPGAGLSLTVRGQGNPYVLIDGVAGDINLVNPNDIENISVLKDAAASAIYGARAPYGVVLVTTKSGKKNQKVQVDFSANVSFTQAINKPKMVDSYTFARAMNEMHDNQGEPRRMKEETIDRIIAYMNDPSLPETIANGNTWYDNLDSNGNNDWIDIIYGTGMRHQENLSVKGGGEKMSFFVSAGHVYEKGLFNYGTDNYRRVNLNTKLDFNITKWWKFSSNTRMAQTVRQEPSGNNDSGYRTIIHHVIRTYPTNYFKSPNGYYAERPHIPTLENGFQTTTRRNLVQNLAMELTPVKGWKINADYAIDFLYANNDNAMHTAYLDRVDGTLYPIASTTQTWVNKYKQHTSYQSYNIFTSYEASVADSHNFKIMAGFQHEWNRYDRLQADKNEITPSVPSITTSTGEEIKATDDMTHWATLGYFARFNYDYKGRYLFEANFRYDGTSRFARGNRWGAFPSFSAGWNVSKERFWVPLTKYVNEFKVRASWGSLGNQGVDAYQDLPLLTVNRQLGWIMGDARPAYITGPNLVNRNLTWETSSTVDVGLDMGFLRNRLLFTFDWYQRTTKDRLGRAEQLPAVLGALVPSENNAELRTRGWDLQISWRDNPTKDFSYSVTATLFDYKTVYTKYKNPQGLLSDTYYPGYVSGSIWGYTSLGLIKTQEMADAVNGSGRQAFISRDEWKTGDVLYADLNGDGVVNKGKELVSDHGDWTIIGNTTPRFQFGLTLSAAWKGLDLKAFFQGVGKRDYWLSGNMFWGFSAWNQSSLFTNHMDYYRDREGEKYSGLGINTDSYYPRPYSNTTQDNKNKQVQTRYLQNGAYVRLKNLQIGYTFPSRWLEKVRISNLRIYLSGENIWTISSLPAGFDPETANMGELGNGKLMFTQAVYAIGLNLSF